MKHPVPVLSLNCNANILTTLHVVLLPELGLMKIFQVMMRSILTFLGGLNLRLLEVKAIAQNVCYLVSLCASETPTKLLLKTIIENYQLELGTNK